MSQGGWGGSSFSSRWHVGYHKLWGLGLVGSLVYGLLQGTPRAVVVGPCFIEVGTATNLSSL